MEILNSLVSGFYISPVTAVHIVIRESEMMMK